MLLEPSLEIADGLMLYRGILLGVYIIYKVSHLNVSVHASIDTKYRVVDAAQLAIGDECYLWILLLRYVVYRKEMLGEWHHQSAGTLYE